MREMRLRMPRRWRHRRKLPLTTQEKKALWRKRILLGLLGVLLLLAAYPAFLWWWAHHNLHQALLLSPEDGSPLGENVLVIASDSHNINDPAEYGPRAVIQLVHLDEHRHHGYVIHLPSSLKVSIPCGPSHCDGLAPADDTATLVSSYVWGARWRKPGLTPAEGASQLLVKTVERLLSSSDQKFHVDHVVVASFCGFSHVVDDLGGVDVRVPQPVDLGLIPADASCDTGGAFGEWSAGRHHMSGFQALGFVRSRQQPTFGDLDRGIAEQALMAAIYRRVSSGALLDPLVLPNLIGHGLHNTLVDQHMSLGYLVGLGSTVGSDAIPFKYFTAPFSRDHASVPGIGDALAYDRRQMESLGYDLRNDVMDGYALNQNDVG